VKVQEGRDAAPVVLEAVRVDVAVERDAQLAQVRGREEGGRRLGDEGAVGGEADVEAPACRGVEEGPERGVEERLALHVEMEMASEAREAVQDELEADRREELAGASRGRAEGAGQVADVRDLEEYLVEARCGNSDQRLPTVSRYSRLWCLK
jgi:hypothetical protein